jgi:hypothetical protein
MNVFGNKAGSRMYLWEPCWKYLFVIRGLKEGA